MKTKQTRKTSKDYKRRPIKFALDGVIADFTGLSGRPNLERQETLSRMPTLDSISHGWSICRNQRVRTLKTGRKAWRVDIPRLKQTLGDASMSWIGIAS
jgi:hypothetical protein